MAELYRSDIVDVDISKPLLRTYAGILLATGDKNANRFGANIFRAGEPVDLTGCTVLAYFIRPNTDTLPVDGAVEGNTAYVDLPAACYTNNGAFSLAIKISSVSGEDITHTVRVVDGYIRLTQTDTLVDPGEVVPTLDDLLAHIADMEEATEAAKNAANGAPTAIEVDASGALVTIADGAARNALSLVSTITAAQEGSGDPSPDNVRMISGWETVQLFHGAAYDETAEAALTAALSETVYGGTLDWTTGVLTVDSFALTYDGTEGWDSSGTYFRIGSVTDTRMNKIYQEKSSSLYRYTCSHYNNVSYGMSNKPDHCCYMYAGSKGKTLAIADNAYADVDSWCAYLAEQAAAGTPLTCVYKRQTPNTIQLDPQTLTLLKGDNAIWSDCGDTSIVYVADTKLYIDNKFAALQNAILAQGVNI